MELRRYKDILAIRTSSGKILGLHTRNLELANLDEQAWSSLPVANPITAQNLFLEPLPQGEELNLDSPLVEIEAWNAEVGSQARDQQMRQKVKNLSINIAQICNLACTYCAAGDGSYGSAVKKLDLTKAFQQLQFFLNPLRENESFHIRFLGGEPLLYPSAIRQIADYARLLVAHKNVKLSFGITTNGTLISEKVAELLADLACDVVISMDGPPEINDVHRPTVSGRGSSALVLKGLENLAKVRSRLGNLQVNAVFGTHNLKVVETYKFFSQFSFDSYGFNFALDKLPASSENQSSDTAEIPGNALKEGLSPSEIYIQEMRALAEFIFQKEGAAGLVKISEFGTLLNTLETQERKLNFCGAGKSLLQSDTQSNLYACNWFMNDPKEKVGTVDVLNEQKMAPYAQDLISANNCGKCWARFLCGGGCLFGNRSVNGDKNQKDLAFCFRMRNLVVIAAEYYAKFLERGEYAAH